MLGGFEGKCLVGQFSPDWIEGSACFDCVSRKAYIFGGCSEDYRLLTVNAETGAITVLSSRYFSTLLEIDIDNRSMGAIERSPSESSHYAQGPEERGYAMVSAYSTLGTSSSSTIIMGFGYTTFDPELGMFSNVRCFGDVWECRVNEQPAVDGLELSAAQGQRESKLRTHPSSKPHLASRAEVFRYNPMDVFETMRLQIVNKPLVRQFLGDLCPGDCGPGALVAPLVLPNGRPCTVETFFDKVHLGTWVPEDQLRARFPNISRFAPDVEEMLITIDPVQSFMIVCVCAEGTKLSNGHPYWIAGGRFGRYIPGASYLSVNEAGEICDSSLAEGMTTESEPKGVETHALDICANQSNCPNMTSRLNAVAESMQLGMSAELAAARLSKLKECAGCNTVKYCGSACQQADWKRHKTLCKEVAAKKAQAGVGK